MPGYKQRKNKRIRKKVQAFNDAEIQISLEKLDRDTELGTTVEDEVEKVFLVLIRGKGRENYEHIRRMIRKLERDGDLEIV